MASRIYEDGSQDIAPRTYRVAAGSTALDSGDEPDALQNLGTTLSVRSTISHLRIPAQCASTSVEAHLTVDVTGSQSAIYDGYSPASSTMTVVPTPSDYGSSSRADMPTGDTVSGQPLARNLKVSDLTPLGHLGKGAHGQVLLAYDNVTQQELALKIVEKDSLHLTSYPRIFEEQLVGKKLLGCEWAMSVEGTFQDHEYFYFLSRYYPGGDLTKFVRYCGGKLPYALARHYTAELVIAAEELHGRQVMHRDIKPDNILLDEDGHLVLADFGVSRCFGEPEGSRPWERSSRWARSAVTKRLPSQSRSKTEAHDDTCTPCGTPGFMAPETFDKHYSYGADVWSIGIVLHYLLMGRLPFGMLPARQSHRELKMRTNALQLEFGADELVPGHARALLKRMLDKDPEKRITISQIKDHGFFAGIDWNALRERKSSLDFPFLRSYLLQRLTHRPRQQGVVLTSGSPYEIGRSPFPWFEFVSEVLVETVPKNLDVYGADESSTHIPRSRRKAPSLVKRFQGLWKRSHLTAVELTVSSSS